MKHTYSILFYSVTVEAILEKHGDLSGLYFLLFRTNSSLHNSYFWVVVFFYIIFFNMENNRKNSSLSHFATHMAVMLAQAKANVQELLTQWMAGRAAGQLGHLSLAS